MFLLFRTIVYNFKNIFIIGSSLAIGSSYMYEQDVHPDPIPENHVYIRYVTDQETKPK